MRLPKLLVWIINKLDERIYMSFESQLCMEGRRLLNRAWTSHSHSDINFSDINYWTNQWIDHVRTCEECKRIRKEVNHE